MATKNNTATHQHVRPPADDPTTEALATYLVREEQHGLRDALLTVRCHRPWLLGLDHPQPKR